MNVENRLDDRLAATATAAAGGCFLFLGCILFLFGDLSGSQPFAFAWTELALVAGFGVSLGLLFAYPKQAEWARFVTLGLSTFVHAAIAGYAFSSLQSGLAQSAMIGAEFTIAAICAMAMFSRILDVAPREVRKIERLSGTMFEQRESPIAPAALARKARMRMPLNVRIAASQAVHKFI